VATRFRFKIGCYGPRCGPELANTSSSQSPLVFVGIGGRPRNRPLCYAWRQNMAGCLPRGRDTGLKLGLNLLGDFLEISAWLYSRSRARCCPVGKTRSPPRPTIIARSS
jgi:hypothetical protein